MKQILNQEGQSIVELALITPLLLVALYVPFDFGVTMYTGHLTQNAVRDAARTAAITDLMDSTKATSVATQTYPKLPAMLVSGSQGTKQVTVNYYGDPGSTGCAQSVEVVAQGTYNFFLYRVITLFGFPPPDPILIRRTTRMRYEHQPDTNSANCATVTATGHS